MEEMRLSVTNAHLELMNRTPFGRLFKTYHENLIIDGVCRKCDVNIVSILKCYDPVQKAFVFGGITATITAKDIINLNSRKRKSAFTGFYERCLADVKDISKKILEERILRVAKLHGSVHEGDFVLLSEILSELYAKMEIMKIHEEENHTTAFTWWGGGVNVEPHKVSDEEFLPMFDILPSEFMENNLGEPSSSKADLNDLERKLQGMSLLVEDYRSEIMKLTIENENLKEELKSKENYIQFKCMNMGTQK
ncbi:unnamed protein product [Malus baccata var. baccata]